MKIDIAIINGNILVSQNGKFESIAGDILIKDDKIFEIILADEMAIEFVAKKTIDAKGKLSMPGLINTHTHSAMTAFRGYADDITLHAWLNEVIFPIEKKNVNVNLVTIGAKLAIIEMIKSGTTTFNDMYYFIDTIAEVAKQIGMRAMLSEGVLDFPTPNMKTSADSLKYTEELILKYKNDELIKIALGPHAPYTCSPELLKLTKKLADKYATQLNIHLAETKWELDLYLDKHKMTPTQYLDSLGMLDENVIAAHSIFLNESDIDLMAKRKTGVAHNPECNMKLASGVAPIPAMLNKGVKVGIGTDGVASNNNLNIFQEIRTAAFLHKLTSNDPTVLNANQLLKMATIDGAKLLNIDKQTGSIEKGKLADIIIIDMQQPHLVPLFNVSSQLVYSMDGSEVDTVVINGKLVMEKRQLLNINEKDVIAEMQELAKTITL